MKPQRQTRRPRWDFLEIFACALFVLWSAAGLYTTIYHLGPGDAVRMGVPPALAPFVNACLQYGDPILILLAFINTHLHAARQWGGFDARRWALIVVLAAFAVETVGAMTGFPFGTYHYTGRFGPMLYLVPAVIPLAWHVVVTNSLFVVRMVMPHLSAVVEAVLAAAICTLYDYILEPFATTLKGYWIWEHLSVPALNYAAWFILSGLLVWLFAPTIASRFRWDPRPALILGVTVLIFLAGTA